MKETKKLTLNLDIELYERLKKYADEQRMPMTMVMRQLILKATEGEDNESKN